MKFSEKDIRIFRGISMAAGIFTLLVAGTMLLSLIQLKTINPLDSPSLKAVTEQFDSNPDSRDKAEQVRAMDLMARKAYFSSRWQVETGSYLMLAGAVLFVFLQRLVAGNEKPSRSWLPGRPDIASEKKSNRNYLLISAGSIIVVAIISSFVLRSELPDPGRSSAGLMTAGSPPDSEKSLLPDNVNFPFFRGAGSNGIAGGSDYPTEWNASENKNIKWKSAVPLQGKSSPVIWGDKLFLTGAGEGKLEVYCFDKKSGKILWTGSGVGFPGSSSEEPESDAEAGMAVPTPAVNEKSVCAIFGNGNLVCFDHDGKLLWGKNLGVPVSTYGFSSSLLIYDKLLLVQYDGQNKISLAGYDTGSGEMVWETLRNGRPVNSSPVLALFDGQVQVLVNGNPNVSAYDPVTGKELWSLPGVSGDVAPSLAVNSKFVYAAQDYYRVMALKPGKSGSTVWEDNTFTPDAASPVANDNYLFIATGTGDVACYNAEKGDTLWSHYFENQFYASPVIADDKVYFLDREGIAHIVNAANEFKLISESPIGERSDCTPAFSEKEIFIRAHNNLYCISAN